MSQAAVSRPASVTLLMVLTYINGALAVISGIVLLAFAGNRAAQDAMDVGAGQIRVFGIFEIVVGLIVLAVASALGRGSSGARMLVTVIQVISLAAAVYAVFAYGSGRISSVIGGAVVSLVILWLMWNRKANEFFA
jgi:uncharacterized protein YjeT (DUF2065 family)